MRLASWNCRGALERKEHVLDEIGADVLVVQECSEAYARSAGAPWSPPYAGGAKGIGVFCRDPWKAAPVGTDPDMPWVLPVELSNLQTGRRITLLAFWANKTRSGLSYAGQFAMLLDSCAQMIRSGECLIAGDLNASIQGPSRKPHAENLRRAHDLGLVSAYHHSGGVKHGDETDMTLRWIGPGRKEYFYHCDFIFLPRQLAAGSSSTVVDTFGWIPPVSDHQPVFVDIPGL